jgi:hypothetical protein
MSSQANKPDKRAKVTLYSKVIDAVEIELSTDNCVNGQEIASLFGYVLDTVTLTLQGPGVDESIYAFDLMQDEGKNMEVLPSRMYCVSGVLEEALKISNIALHGMARATDATMNMSAGAGSAGGGSAGGYGQSARSELLSEVANNINGNQEFIVEFTSIPSKRWQQDPALTDGRPWGRGCSTTNKDLPNYVGYMYKCEGGYQCLNTECPHAKTNTGNKGTQRFMSKTVPDTDGKKVVICCICESSQVRPMPCNCTKKLFRLKDSNSVIVQHTGNHTAACTRPLKTANAISPATKESLSRLSALGLSPARAKVKIMEEVYDETMAGRNTFDQFMATSAELGQDRAVQAVVAQSRKESKGSSGGAGASENNLLLSIVEWKQSCQQPLSTGPFLRAFNMPELDATIPEYYFCMTTEQVKMAATIGQGDMYSRNTTMVHFDFKHNVIRHYKTMGAHFMDKTTRRIQTLATMHSLNP